MFNNDELEGCPSVRMEEWLQKNEVLIRLIAIPGNNLDAIIQLLIDCWDAKRCPYA